MILIINSVIESYDEEENNVIDTKDKSDIISLNSEFINKLFIKEDIYLPHLTEDKDKDKENNDILNENMKNLFNEKNENIEDNLDDLISNLTNLNKILISSVENNPLSYNYSSLNIKDLEILYIDLLQFCNICTTIFYSVTINGLGKASQEEPEKNQNQEDGKVYEGGYGMSGDAKGVENISKQIEDEEQLLGLRDENDNNDNNNDDENNNNNEENKDDDAFEMKTDFKEDYNKEMNQNESEENNILETYSPKLRPIPFF